MGRSLLVYTGGTFGMAPSDPHHPDSPLVPLPWDRLVASTPALAPLLEAIDVRSLPHIDSSDITPAYWLDLARTIRDACDDYDGFVILHGTDTMAYTASALSFLLEGLAKPVVLTGASRPVGDTTSDAIRNLTFALRVACPGRSGLPVVPEVTVCFGGLLLRGNRARKLTLTSPEVFRSPNYPPLARAEAPATVNRQLVREPEPGPFRIHEQMGGHVLLLDVFPGLPDSFLEQALHTPGLAAVVLRTYGTGNTPSSRALLDPVADACVRGVIIANISQCTEGAVVMDRYAGGAALHATGVISGGDMTPEAALTKLQVLLGTGLPTENVKTMFQQDLRGERSC